MGIVKSMLFLGIEGSFSFINIVDLVVVCAYRGYRKRFSLAHRSRLWLVAVTRPWSRGSLLEWGGWGRMSPAQVVQQIRTDAHKYFCCDWVYTSEAQVVGCLLVTRSQLGIGPLPASTQSSAPFQNLGVPSVCKYWVLGEIPLSWAGGYIRHLEQSPLDIGLPGMPMRIANKEILLHHHVPCPSQSYSFGAEFGSVLAAPHLAVWTQA